MNTRARFDEDGSPRAVRDKGGRSKKKCALVIGYVGSDFNGLQIGTEDSRTVEQVLEEGLYQAGFISPDNHGDLGKIGWTRTSRTDKGVHAAKTVIAAKLMIEPATFDAKGFSPQSAEEINAHLPPDLRVFSCAKVAKSFRGRDSCTMREYQYVMPKSFFPDEASLARFSELIGLYTGTHSFHNFCSGSRELRAKKKVIIQKLEEREGEAATATAAAAAAAAVALPSPPPPPPPQQQQVAAGVAGTQEGGGGGGSRGAEGTGGEEEAQDDAEEGRFRKLSPRSIRGSVTRLARKVLRLGRGTGTPTTSASTQHVDGEDDDGDGVGNDTASVKSDVSSASSSGGSSSSDGSGVSRTKFQKDREYREYGEDSPLVRRMVLKEMTTSIYSSEVVDAGVRLGEEGTEYIRLSIKGQAFQYNQVRLMIGGALLEALGLHPPGMLRTALHTTFLVPILLAPAEGLILASQTFTKVANAFVLEPDSLQHVQGEEVYYTDDVQKQMTSRARKQALMTEASLAASDAFRDSEILTEVAKKWTESEVQERWLDHAKNRFTMHPGPKLDMLTEAAAEELELKETSDREKMDRDMVVRREKAAKGVTDYKDLLPRNFSTDLVIRQGVIPSNKVACVQRALASRINKGELDAGSSKEELFAVIDRVGYETLFSEGLELGRAGDAARTRGGSSGKDAQRARTAQWERAGGSARGGNRSPGREPRGRN